MRPNELRVEFWSVADLRPSPRNPRVHSDEQVDQICASIREFGFTNPVLIDPSGEIIAGEGRWLAARRLALGDVPVIVLAHLTPVQCEAYRVADNKIPLNASWNEKLLSEVVRGLDAAGFRMPVLGFSAKELDHLLEPPPVGGRTDPDAAPPLEPVLITRPGDLWEMRGHRLLCGDSTSVEAVALLMRGGVARMSVVDPPGNEPPDMLFGTEPADLVFTDPPYGMSCGGGRAAGTSAPGARVKAHGMIKGDDAKGEDLVALVRGALRNAINFSRADTAIYVCLTWRTYAEFREALSACGLAIAACIVWDKGSIGLGNSHYRPQHEFIFYCKGERWFGGKAEGDLWQCSRGATAEYVHPTQKPVELIERAIRNSSRAGDVVLDLFGGSGSTLIACESLGRQARLVDLDPKYCDAIVRRWEAFTGDVARLAGDGRTFEEVAAERGAAAAGD